MSYPKLCGEFKMYDYKAGKKRVEEILKNDIDVINKSKLPKSDDLTFDNSYYSWVSSIFIDIRDSTTLFEEEDNKNVSKIMKSFTSELIEIMRKSDNLREIGIRGDCVYSIYTCPTLDDTYETYKIVYYCNTFIKMLNKLLSDNNLPELNVGIGVGLSKSLIIKAGRKYTGYNDKIWIGDAVINASNLSSISQQDSMNDIIVDFCFYDNLIKKHERAKRFFYEKDTKYGKCYSADIIDVEFNDWINSGML
jgi:class 3 adenylate cyclase